MALVEYTLYGRIDKVQIAIERLRAFEPPEGYYLCFSGGKDSVCIKALADMAGVKYDAHYNVTSVDPPELVQFIKDEYLDVSRDIPEDESEKPVTMWSLILKKMFPPLRQARYCCEYLKETNGDGRVTVTGVRWAESARRQRDRGLINLGNTKATSIVYNDDNDEARRMVEQCYRTQKTLVNPIIDWTDDDVWEFIRTYNLKYCSLYDKGHKRLGCLGCPMSNHVEEELEAYPKIKAQYIRTFDKMLLIRKAAGKENKYNWQSGEDVYNWWVSRERRTKEIEGQESFFKNESEE